MVLDSPEKKPESANALTVLAELAAGPGVVPSAGGATAADKGNDDADAMITSVSAGATKDEPPRPKKSASAAASLQVHGATGKWGSHYAWWAGSAVCTPTSDRHRQRVFLCYR